MGFEEGIRLRTAGSEALVLDGGLEEQLMSMARAALPHEACAILSGPHAGVATRLHPARNALASPHRYDLHPEDLVRIVSGIEACAEVMVAIFHSHPTGRAVPSASDLRESRYDVVHLIAGLGEGRLGAWRIRDGRATEVGLRATARG